MLTHIDLFSGIGGFSLAAEWAGFKTIVFCEKDEYCQKVLRKHWPEVPIISEIRDFHWPLADSEFKGLERGQERPIKGMGERFVRCHPITLLTGGFPCQPFSVAGKRRGKEDDRFLWPEMFRVISEVRPAWILAENVAGIVRMALDDCLSDLESEGYETETFIIPACAVNAPHRRDRVWIAAHSLGARAGSRRETVGHEGGRTSQDRREGIRQEDGAVGTSGTRSTDSDAPDAVFTRTGKQAINLHYGEQAQTIGQVGLRNGSNADAWDIAWIEVATHLCRMDDGVSNRVDRLKALGNAVVPQVTYEILKIIALIENNP